MQKDNTYRRVALPILAITAGMLLVLHGLKDHTITLVEIHEIEEEAPMPPMMGPPGGGPPGFGGPPGGMPQFQLPPHMRPKITIRLEVPIYEHEKTIVKEVTYGGVARNDIGQLMRTYSGKPPSLCPT